jgi:MtN3 and saliva related transmembrane protein
LETLTQITAVAFGLGLGANALIFVPQIIAIWRRKTSEGVSTATFAAFNVLQAIGIAHGFFQRDYALMLGMIASLVSSGTVTVLALRYRPEWAAKTTENYTRG